MLRWTGIIVIMIILFTQAGCWDVQDVADTAFVTAVGLDASDQPDRIKVTFAIPKPSLIKSRSDRVVSVNQTVEAESISRAVEKLETRLSRNVRFGHLRIIVIGEKLSTKNFQEYTNFFTKNPEVALRTRSIFVQGKEAKDVLTVPPIFNRSMAAELVGLSMAGKKNALERAISLQDLRKDLSRANGTAIAPRIIIKKDNKKPFVEHEGGAVLKGWRLIGWLNDNEIKSANLFLDKSKPKVSGKIGGSEYTFSVDRKSLKIIPQTKGDSLGFLVKLKVTGNIIEEPFGLDLSKPENINKAQKLLAAVITDQLVNAIEKSQKQLKVDYLGFGKALEIKNSRFYRKVDWDKVYPNVPVNVQVQAKVHRYGKTR